MADLKTLLYNNNQNIKSYIDAIKIKYEDKKIILSNGKNVESSIDATDFIKDGMIENVELIDKNLIITWNTDAGKNATTIPFNDFIDIYTIESEDTDTIDITASTKGNKHIVNAKIKDQSITNDHIATNAAIDKTKLATDVQTSLDKADSAIQTFKEYAKIGNDTNSYTDDTIYGAKAYAEHYANNLTEISSSDSSIKITEYDVDIQADTAVKIRTTGTNSSVKFDTNHVKVPEPEESDDAANKGYVDSKITDNIITEEKLNEKNYVTAEILEDSGKISLNTNWDKVYNKPEYFDTNWELIDNKPTNLATTDHISSLSNGLQTKISKTEDIIKETNNWNFQNTSLSNISSISSSGTETKYYYEDDYSTIELEADNSSIKINRGLHITGEYALDLSTNSSQILDSLSITSANSILLNVGNTDDSYIKANGNIKLPSNYSILDENGNDRLVNQSSINTLIDDNGLIFKSEDNSENLSSNFSLTKNSMNSAMLDFYFSGVSGTLDCASNLSLAGYGGVTIVGPGAHIDLDNGPDIKLKARVVSVDGAFDLGSSCDPNAIIPYGGIMMASPNGTRYFVYINDDGILTAKKI